MMVALIILFLRLNEISEFLKNLNSFVDEIIFSKNYASNKFEKKLLKIN